MMIPACLQGRGNGRWWSSSTAPAPSLPWIYGEGWGRVPVQWRSWSWAGKWEEGGHSSTWKKIPLSVHNRWKFFCSYLSPSWYATYIVAVETLYLFLCCTRQLSAETIDLLTFIFSQSRGVIVTREMSGGQVLTCLNELIHFLAPPLAAVLLLALLVAVLNEKVRDRNWDDKSPHCLCFCTTLF